MVDETTTPVLADGTVPLVAEKTGVAPCALNSTYPLTVAPLAGKVAASHAKSIWSKAIAVAVKLAACAVGGLDKV